MSPRFGLRKKVPGDPTTQPCFRMMAGERLPLEELPSKLFKTRREDEYVGDKRMHSLPPVFVGSGVFVDDSIADIMRDFDIYEHALHPVELYLMDEVTKIDKRYYMLNFGVQKPTIDIEHSETVERTYPGYEWFSITSSPRTEKIYSLPDAYEGPDLWVDPKFSHLFFVSDGLGAAIKKAKLSKAFPLYPMLPPINV